MGQQISHTRLRSSRQWNSHTSTTIPAQATTHDVETADARTGKSSPRATETESFSLYGDTTLHTGTDRITDPEARTAGEDTPHKAPKPPTHGQATHCPSQGPSLSVRAERALPAPTTPHARPVNTPLPSVPASPEPVYVSCSFPRRRTRATACTRALSTPGAAAVSWWRARRSPLQGMDASPVRLGAPVRRTSRHREYVPSRPPRRARTARARSRPGRALRDGWARQKARPP